MLCNHTYNYTQNINSVASSATTRMKRLRSNSPSLPLSTNNRRSTKIMLTAPYTKLNKHLHVYCGLSSSSSPSEHKDVMYSDKVSRGHLLAQPPQHSTSPLTQLSFTCSIERWCVWMCTHYKIPEIPTCLLFPPLPLPSFTRSSSASLPRYFQTQLWEQRILAQNNTGMLSTYV